MLGGGAPECHARPRTHLTVFSWGSWAHVRFWHKGAGDLGGREPAARVGPANLGGRFFSVSPLLENSYRPLGYRSPKGLSGVLVLRLRKPVGCHTQRQRYDFVRSISTLARPLLSSLSPPIGKLFPRPY